MGRVVQKQGIEIKSVMHDNFCVTLIFDMLVAPDWDLFMVWKPFG